jgi:hypothetical protein
MNVLLVIEVRMIVGYFGEVSRSWVKLSVCECIEMGLAYSSYIHDARI